MIKINSNLFQPSISDFIENILKNKKTYTDKFIPQPFPFYYQENMTFESHTQKEDSYQDVGFSHAFYQETSKLYSFDYWPIMSNILYGVCFHYNIFIEKILDGRVFLQPPSKTPYNQEIHTDFPFPSNVPYYSLIYYVSDSDGDTVFYNNNNEEIKRVTPEKGKIVLFDGHIFHRGTKPVNKTKLLLNFIFQGSYYNKLI